LVWNWVVFKDFEPRLHLGFYQDAKGAARRLEVIEDYREQLAVAIRDFLPGSFFPTSPSAAMPTGLPND
jgi:hypothetical protein